MCIPTLKSKYIFAILICMEYNAILSTIHNIAADNFSIGIRIYTSVNSKVLQNKLHVKTPTKSQSWCNILCKYIKPYFIINYRLITCNY